MGGSTYLILRASRGKYPELSIIPGIVLIIIFMAAGIYVWATQQHPGVKIVECKGGLTVLISTYGWEERVVNDRIELKLNEWLNRHPSVTSLNFVREERVSSTKMIRHYHIILGGDVSP